MEVDDHKNLNENQKEVAVLFSGGRDSSLAASLFALKGYNVHLLSFISGIGVKSEISEYRYEELRNRFPRNIVARTIIPTFGLVRHIALMDIENDFARYKVNLILVGEKLAMHAASTVYCIQNGIKLVADGTSTYQEDFPEQMPTAINLFRSFHEAYGVQYSTPIKEFVSENEVKYTLMELGISTKSLEGISMFADSFTTPTSEVLKEYIEEKLPFCHNHIKLILSGNKLSDNLTISSNISK